VLKRAMERVREASKGTMNPLLAEVERAAEIIQSGHERIAAIVQDLKAFAKKDVHGLKPADLHHGLDATISLLTQYVNGGGRLYMGGHDIAWAACTASGYDSPSRCNFVKSILKFNYVSDPTTVSRMNGVTADPISGAYTAPNGVSYTQHRSGGAADEGNTFNAGGTTTRVWNTTTGGLPPTAAVKSRWPGADWSHQLAGSEKTLDSPRT